MIASIRPSIPPEGKSSSSPPRTERRKEDVGGTAREREDVKGRDEPGNAQRDVDVAHLIDELACETEQKEQACVSSSAFSLNAIDGIVDRHLGDFSSEVQLLLQEQSIHYNVPQSPHSTSNTDTSEHQHVPPQSSISQLSQYVSFYNPSPPVHDYVHSLQTSIGSVLAEFEKRLSRDADDADDALASSVSAFVAGIRSANATTDADADGLAAADVSASDAQTPESWQPDMVHINKGPQTAPTLHPPQIKPVLPHWQQPRGSSETRSVGAGRTAPCAAGAEAALPGFSVVPSEPVSSSASVSVPPPTALSSLISQLQPEVFSNLVEIIKDVKRNSLQFYLHSTEPEDPFYEDVTVK